MEPKLRHEPKDGDGNGLMRAIKKPMDSSGVLSLSLDEARNECGEDRDGQADAHPLEDGDAPVEAREAAGRGDEKAVVEGDGDEHGCVGEDGHGAGGDLEGMGQVSVHGAGLLLGEGVLLGRSGDEEDSCGPYWAHPYDGFQLFDAVDGAELP